MAKIRKREPKARAVERPGKGVRKFGAIEKLVDPEGISPTLMGLDHGNNTPLVEVDTPPKKKERKETK